MSRPSYMVDESSTSGRFRYRDGKGLLLLIAGTALVAGVRWYASSQESAPEPTPQPTYTPTYVRPIEADTAWHVINR